MDSLGGLPRQKKRYIVLQDEDSTSAVCVKSESYTSTGSPSVVANRHAEASRFPAVDVNRQAESTVSVIASGSLDSQKEGILLTDNTIKTSFDTTKEVKGEGVIINDGASDSSHFTFSKEGQTGSMFRATNNQFNKISYGLVGRTNERTGSAANIYSRLDTLALSNGNLLMATLESSSPPGMWNFKSSLADFDNSPDGSIGLKLFSAATRTWGGAGIVESVDNRDLADFRGNYANSLNFTGVSLAQDPTTENVYLVYCGFWGDNLSKVNSTFNPSFLCVDKILEPLENQNHFSNSSPAKTESVSVTRINSTRLDYDSDNPRMAPDVDGLSAETKPMDVSCEFLADGRLVVCIFYEDSIYSLVSVDKGRTFQANLVKSIGTFLDRLGHVGMVQRVASIDTCIATDGSIAMIAACPNAGDEAGFTSPGNPINHPVSMLSIFSSPNGYSWGAERNLSFDDTGYYNPKVYTEGSGGQTSFDYATGHDLSIYALDVSICLTPDRYLMVTAVTYNIGGPGGAHHQALYQRVLDRRDVSQSASVGALAKAPSFHISGAYGALASMAQRLQRAYPNCADTSGTTSDPMVLAYLDEISRNGQTPVSPQYLGQLYFGGVSAKLVPFKSASFINQGIDVVYNDTTDLNMGGGPMIFKGPIAASTCLFRDSVVTAFSSYRSDAVYDYPNRGSHDTATRNLGTNTHTGTLKVLFSGGLQPAHVRLPNQLGWLTHPVNINGTITRAIQVDRDTYVSRNESFPIRQFGSNSWQLAYDAAVLPPDDDCMFISIETDLSDEDRVSNRPPSQIVRIEDTNIDHDGFIGNLLELNAGVNQGTVFSAVVGMSGTVMSVDTTASTIEIPREEVVFFQPGDYVNVGNSVFRVISTAPMGAMTSTVTLSSAPLSTATTWAACNRFGSGPSRVYMRWPSGYSLDPGTVYVSQGGVQLTVPESGRISVNNSATGFSDVREGDNFTVIAQGITGNFSGVITGVNSSSFEVVFMAGDIDTLQNASSSTITVGTQLSSNVSQTVNRTFTVTGLNGTPAIKEVAFIGSTSYAFVLNGVNQGHQRTWWNNNAGASGISNGDTIQTSPIADVTKHICNPFQNTLPTYNNSILKTVNSAGGVRSRLSTDVNDAEDREAAFNLVHTSNLSFLSRAVLSIDQGGGYIWNPALQTGTFYGEGAGLTALVIDHERDFSVHLMLLVGRDVTDPTRVGFAVKDMLHVGSNPIKNIIHIQDSGSAFESGKMRSPEYEVMFCLSWEEKMSSPPTLNGAEIRLLVREYDRHADPDFLNDFTHSISVNTVQINSSVTSGFSQLGFGIFHEGISTSWDHTETTMRVRSYSHCNSYLSNSQCFARVLEAGSAGNDVMDILSLDGRDSAQILNEIDPLSPSTGLNVLKYNNGGTLSPSRPPLTSTFPLHIDGGVEISFAGSAKKGDTFKYFDDSLFRAENVFELPTSAGWMSPSRVLDYQLETGKPEVGVTPSHQLVYDFGENGVLPDSVCLFGVNTDEIMIDFYDDVNTGLGYLESSPSAPSVSLWFGSPHGALAELFFRMVNTDNHSSSPSMKPFTEISFRPNYLFFWRSANWSANRRGGIYAQIGDPESSGIGQIDNKFLHFYEREQDHLPVPEPETMNPRVRQETGLLIPGRFKSGPGENYYLVLWDTPYTSTSNGYLVDNETLNLHIEEGSNAYHRAIFKIEDNGVNWIKTTKSIGDYVMPVPGVGNPWPDRVQIRRFAVFSDRVGSNMPENSCLIEKSDPDSGRDISDFNAYNKYRYMRIRLSGARMMDKDVPSLDLGMVIAGRRVELANPDIEWGWSYNMEFGNKLTTGVTGQRRRRKQHKPRRSWEVSYEPKRSPMVDDSPNVSLRLLDYKNEFRGYGSTRERRGLSSEQETQYNRLSWLEAVQRIVNVEVNGQVFALCFDGDRMLNMVSARRIYQVHGDYDGHNRLQSNKVPPALNDPHQFCVARVTNYGGASHVGYHQQDEFPVGFRFGEPDHVDLFHGSGEAAQKFIGRHFTGGRILPIMKINKIVFSEEF